MNSLSCVYLGTAVLAQAKSEPMRCEYTRKAYASESSRWLSVLVHR